METILFVVAVIGGIVMFNLAKGAWADYKAEEARTRREAIAMHRPCERCGAHGAYTGIWLDAAHTRWVHSTDRGVPRYCVSNRLCELCGEDAPHEQRRYVGLELIEWTHQGCWLAASRGQQGAIDLLARQPVHR
jgi:hypothetical protein